ncbi:MAG TPA: hypothetical protein VLI39_02375 [Sedimentisphaerales bacterium]|nr:hypothetical protein [Sedimentisphaerales bacterium]
MKIVDVKHIEDCFDGSYLHELLFDSEITRDFILGLRSAAEVQYYPDFARPFFKATVPGRFTLKGIEGNQTARVISYDASIQRTVDDLRSLLAAMDNTEAGRERRGPEFRTDAIGTHIE